jgi:hypothetical protein
MKALRGCTRAAGAGLFEKGSDGIGIGDIEKARGGCGGGGG